MKKLFLALFLAVCGIAWAEQDNPVKEFTPELTALLKAYEGTSEPVLPVEEMRGEVSRDLSVVPGRMFLPRSITVDKPRCRVYLLTVFNDTLLRYGVCASRNRGQKKTADDCRTPEGTFKIHGVYNSTDWTYKDTDSKCYGPFFIHLKTPRFYGIGLHGTNAPGSIPGRSSHGCMRLLNDNISVLKTLVTKDMLVTVLPDRCRESSEETSARVSVNEDKVAADGNKEVESRSEHAADAI